jgi:hypothetical protein
VGVPVPAAQGVRDTPGGAVSAAADLPTRLADMTLHTARTAFMESLNTVAAISAVTAGVLAVACGILVRRPD